MRRVLVSRILGFALLANLAFACASAPYSEDFDRDPASGWANDPSQDRERDEEIREAQREAYLRRQMIIESAKTQRDITLGMTASDVAAVWGEPRSVDMAGDERSGNQRWVYYEGLSSRYGISGTRTVYFENGRVVGWDSR